MRERCGCALDGEETCAGRRWPEWCRRRPKPGCPVHGLRGGVDPASERLSQVPQQHLSRARDHVGPVCGPFRLHADRLRIPARSQPPGLLAADVAAGALFASVHLHPDLCHGPRLVPLPTATAISFTSPFIVTALAPLLLGEAVGRYRW